VLSRGWCRLTSKRIQIALSFLLQLGSCCLHGSKASEISSVNLLLTHSLPPSLPPSSPSPPDAPFFDLVVAIIRLLDLSSLHHHLDRSPVDGFLEACRGSHCISGEGGQGNMKVTPYLPSS